jgi:glycosyltransferase involved in cell wall biosynthesis
VPAHRKRIGINLLSIGSNRIMGTGRFLKQLIENLPRVENVELVFFCRRRFDLENYFAMPAGLSYRRVDCPSFQSHFGRVVYEQLVMPFKVQGLDVLFSPCVANPAIHPGVPTITVIHDLTPFFVRAKYGFVQQSYVRMISRVLAFASSRIVTVSESSRADLIREFRINPAKIDIVYNSCSRKDLAGASYGNYFLFVGTLQPGKNLPDTIRAFALFSRKYDRANHQLVIAGAFGWGSEDYRALIEELGMESRIVLRGYVSDEELNELYAGCKGLILMSLYEGFGIPPLEALSWNKPSIVSKTSSLPEVVGKTGIQVDPSNCEEAARAMGDIAEAPDKFLDGREEQLAKFAPERQAWKFLHILGAS